LRADAQHAAGIIDIIIKNNMAINFLAIPNDAAARILDRGGFTQKYSCRI